MKLIHTSDWHFGMGVGTGNYEADQRFFLQQLYECIRQEGAEAVLLSGDVFDSSVTNAQAIELYNEAVTTLCQELGIKVFVIAGNHDSGSRLAFADKLLCNQGVYIAGDVDGHMLAVPKKHVKNILDCDLDTLNHVMVAVKRVANHCVTNGGYEGVNLLNASDESAGQSVPHFHIHLIPRKVGDGVDAWPKFKGAECEIEDTWKRVKMIG